MTRADEVREKARAFDPDLKYKKTVDGALDLARKLNKEYPWRNRPELIDRLTPEDLYNPGHQDYFFDWIEHKLKGLRHIYIGHAGVWENAARNINEFKALMRIAVDDSTPLHQKVDAPWQNIKMWGGDKHIAKKIMNCFYPDINIYAYKTSNLERFCEIVGIAKTAIEK